LIVHRLIRLFSPHRSSAAVATTRVVYPAIIPQVEAAEVMVKKIDAYWHTLNTGNPEVPSE